LVTRGPRRCNDAIAQSLGFQKFDQGRKVPHVAPLLRDDLRCEDGVDILLFGETNEILDRDLAAEIEGLDA